MTSCGHVLCGAREHNRESLHHLTSSLVLSFPRHVKVFDDFSDMARADLSDQKGRCTRCKKEEIEVYPIDENVSYLVFVFHITEIELKLQIHPDLRSWFGNPTDNVAVVAASLKRTVQELEVGSLAISSVS